MKKYQNFYLKIFDFLVVKFSVYLNRRVFVMPAFRSPFWGRGRLFCFSSVCRLCTVCQGLFALPLGVIGKTMLVIMVFMDIFGTIFDYLSSRNMHS